MSSIGANIRVNVTYLQGFILLDYPTESIKGVILQLDHKNKI